MNFITKLMNAAEAAPTPETAQVADQPMMQFMSWFFLAVGVYLLYAAITGKGQLYKNDYPDSIKEDVFKMTRLMAWVISPIMIFGSLIDLKFIPLPSIVSIITVGVVFLVIVLYVVILYKRHGKVFKQMREASKKLKF